MDAEHVGMSARWFSLTLVKGDEGVEAGEEGADGTLLGEGGDCKDIFEHRVHAKRLVSASTAWRRKPEMPSKALIENCISKETRIHILME